MQRGRGGGEVLGGAMRLLKGGREGGREQWECPATAMKEDEIQAK